MRRSVRKHRTDTIFVLVVFCVFAASVLMVLMLGGGIYQNTTELSHNGYDERTSLSYIWSKVKNSDVAGSIFLNEYDGVTALVFEESYYGMKFHTMIYSHDGWMYESSGVAGLFFGLDAGQQIVKSTPLIFEDTDEGLIKVSLNDNSLYIYPRK